MQLATALCVEKSQAWVTGGQCLDMGLLDSTVALTTTCRAEVSLVIS